MRVEFVDRECNWTISNSEAVERSGFLDHTVYPLLFEHLNRLTIIEHALAVEGLARKCLCPNCTHQALMPVGQPLATPATSRGWLGLAGWLWLGLGLAGFS